ncbi:RNA methyltransferase, TrmA family [Caldicellulosiruptor saccharolyticus DSM 8903]|uniref:RNA methyltransferase, TrmA family n=1 Tax=Caldicellulosiruptor saccharolyticus (strain ATCC 43494 / DSM 8903 / Tp8T 6331) TaxID=351627 RepID=A4XGR8_CALS8|nr:23S rRNA (uracil(1939)-C(5))-methyltransferase RlmD [Caldicellulosiruptor saccharolyticus]ABP66103.1 RNA methyltransferase, TrmA family [Caldicellulosiruptor saccharolyticus DSM 8903]
MVKKSQEYIVKIDTLNHQAQGIARIDGFVVFVDNVLIDEVVKIKIEEVKKEYAKANLIEILEKSPYRKEPECPYYYLCGGCHLMHAKYQHQLKLKKLLVEDAFRRIGKLSPRINDVIGMENPFRYRNKTALPVGGDYKKPQIGFYRKMTHDIVDIDYCLIQHEFCDDVIKGMKDLIQKHKIEVYDEKKHKGVLRHIVVRNSFAFDEMMIILVCTKVPENLETIKKDILNNFSKIKSLYLNLNPKRTNVILGDEDILIWGSSTIKDRIGNLTFEISPKSFFQVNSMQTEVLYSQVVKYLRNIDAEIVFDVYSGIGTISMFIAPFCKKVYTIEIVEDAVEDAKKSSKNNGISNIEFICGRAEIEIPKLLKNGIIPQAVILDPPRSGCEKELLESLIEHKIPNIIYVSCNPSTLARDSSILFSNGYEILEVQPVDMFPQTFHVECVVLMTNVKNK